MIKLSQSTISQCIFNIVAQRCFNVVSTYFACWAVNKATHIRLNIYEPEVTMVEITCFHLVKRICNVFDDIVAIVEFIYC